MADPFAITPEPTPRCANPACRCKLRQEHAALASTGVPVLCDPCERVAIRRRLRDKESQPQASHNQHSFRPDLYPIPHSVPQVVCVLRFAPRLKRRRRLATAERATFAEAVAKFKREFIQEVLARHCGNLGETAAEMGMHRNSLFHMMKKLGMR